MRLGHRARVAGEKIAARLGYDLVKRNWTSPMPELAAIPADHWSRPLPLAGVDLRLADAFDLLELLAPLIATFPDAIPIANGSYESVDAETLYALVRHTQPRRVVELGSGTSSHVINAANSGFQHRIFDPYPWSSTILGAVRGPTVRTLRAEDVPIDEFRALSRGDILFVDTTHTVKTRGDVTRIVLEILPELAPGVLIHFHDIFLPYEYPRHFVVEDRYAWAEQYLLQAFLAFNTTCEIVLPAHALARHDPLRVARLVPSFAASVEPGAFWIRRR